MSSASPAETIQVTQNQYTLITWLWKKCDSHRLLTISNKKIADRFEWSEPYVIKVLRHLEEKGLLKVVEKGQGHGLSQYRLARYSPRDLVVKNQPRGNNKPQKVTPGPQKGTPRKLRLVQDPVQDETHPESSNRRLGVNPKGFTIFSIQAKARPHVTSEYESNFASLFANVKPVKQKVKISGSPFRRFKQRWEDTSTWNATDFVCYYSYLFKARFGEFPELDWPRECGAARVLIGRLKKPKVTKAFLQIAMYRCQFRPRSVSSFTYGDFYDDTVSEAKGGYLDREVLSDFEDEAVFPWLTTESKKEATHKLNKDHLKFLARAAGLI